MPSFLSFVAEAFLCRLLPSVLAAPEPAAPGEPSPPVTQKSLYTGLFVIGIPMLYFGAPLSTVFWVVGASSVLVLGHASMLEPGVVSKRWTRIPSGRHMAFIELY